MCAISGIFQHGSAAPVAQEAVESHKVPRQIVFVEELPGAVLGKLRRRRLRDGSPHTLRP
jgi:acyl-coenzyme A synthetase/AMP-(fatty) acid ligase